MIYPRAGPKAFETAIDDRAGKVKLFTLGNDCLIERFALPLVRLSKVDAQHPRFKLLLHNSPLAVAYLRCAMSILDDVYIRENNESLKDHLFDNGQEALQLFFCVDDGKHNGAVVRDVKGLIPMDSAVGPIAENAAVDRNAGKVVGTHGANQYLMERLVLPMVTLPDVDPHHFCFTLDLDVRGGGSLLRLGNLSRFCNRRFLHLNHP